MPRRGREGRHRGVARQRLGFRDREALHVEGRQGDRLRPPGDGRHGLGLRHVRRQAVGKAQANGIITAMKAKHTYKKSSIVAELWGGQTDQNAFWFKSGNDAVLNPLFKHHKLKKGPQKFVPDWDANNAAGIYDQMLLKTQQQDQGRHRGERQHRGRRDRPREGASPEDGPAVRSGRDGGGCAVHPRGLADGHGLQVRAARGERRGRCGDRATPREEAEVERRSGRTARRRSRRSPFP